jgi:DNA-directed RNA polymerase subunit RPC12/RpoP
MDIYGTPYEIITRAPQEETRTECPYCKGHNTEFVAFDTEDNDWSWYICFPCETQFKLFEPIPF